MRTLSSVGIGLSLVFGCLLLALFLELYYLLYWKKRINNRDIEDDDSGRDFMYMFCWKKQSSLSSAAAAALNPREICSSVTMAENHVHEPQALVHHPRSNKDLWSKPFGEDQDGVEAELVSLQNLSGPPRFLFPIKEETKEDLESEDGKSGGGDKSREGSRGRSSLNDLLLTVETPFLTPLGSPSYFTPPLTPVDSSYNHRHHGFRPLFRSSTDAEFNRVRSSPPPKFKFLKDAEEKLLRRRKLMEEAEKEDQIHKVDGYVQGGGADKAPSASLFPKDQERGPFIKLIVAENQERELNHPHLASSTSTFGPPTNQKPISQ